MSTQMKLIIPLLDPDITKDDISEEAGFVDGYLYDINRPDLDDNIFLMYKTDTNNVKAVRREEKFKNSQYIKNKRFIKINNVYYIIYCFVILNNDIRLIKQGLSLSSISSSFNILSFWNGRDLTVNRAILHVCEPYTIQPDMVPEEDYILDDEDRYAILAETINAGTLK
jgi:hypothetical protein